MGNCYLNKNTKKKYKYNYQTGTYPTGTDGRPYGNVTVLDNVISLSKMLFQENVNVHNILLPNSLKILEANCF